MFHMSNPITRKHTQMLYKYDLHRLKVRRVQFIEIRSKCLTYMPKGSHIISYGIDGYDSGREGEPNRTNSEVQFKPPKYINIRTGSNRINIQGLKVLYT